MSLKLTAFAFAFVRWVALVALALVPTVIVIVAYRKIRGQRLWSLADLPVAAEVTLCLSWLSVLMALDDITRAHMGGVTSIATVAAASLIAAVPVAIGLGKIDELRVMLGLDAKLRYPAAPAQPAA